MQPKSISFESPKVDAILDKKDNKKMIHVAAERGHAEVIRALLDYGSKTTAKSPLKGTRTTALHIVCRYGYLEYVKVLCEHPKAGRYGRQQLQKDTLKRLGLHLAVMNGHLDVVKYLLRNGSPGYACDSSENSAIHYAAAYGWNDILKCLLQAPFTKPGVVNMWKLSPFFIAMIKGHDMCASTLLESKDIDVNALDSDGKSILHYLLNNKEFNPKKTLEHTQRLIELGMNVNVKDPNQHERPLHILSKNPSCECDAEIATILLKADERSDCKDKNGDTPLHLAIG